MTNRDKKDSIRGRMADTGEPYSVARRNVEAAGQHAAEDDGCQLIEVEVGTDPSPHAKTGNPASRASNPRRIETFWGRWVIEPNRERLYPDLFAPRPSNKSVYYGIAQTRRGRIAVYQGKGYPPITDKSVAKDHTWEGALDDYDTLADAQLPPDLKREAAAVLDIREVIHRDI